MSVHFANGPSAARLRIEAAARARGIVDPEEVSRRARDWPKPVFVGQFADEWAEQRKKKEAEAAQKAAKIAAAEAHLANAEKAADLFSQLLSTVEIEAPTKDVRVRLCDIKDAAAAVFGVAINDLCSQRRTAEVVRARQIAMFVAKSLTPSSLPQIGAAFGGRDHTTVLHGTRKIAMAIEHDVAIDRDVRKVMAMARVMASDGRLARARLKAGRAA